MRSSDADAPFFFVVYELKDGQQRMTVLGRAKLRYGVQSVRVGKNKFVYEITHLAGNTRPIEAIRL